MNAQRPQRNRGRVEPERKGLVTANPRFLEFQKAGDIIFICTPKKVPWNRIGQTVARGARARFTHVLLCVMPGLYIQSTTEHGVHLISGESEEGNFPALYGRHWKVMRYNKLSDEARSSLQHRALYYLGQ